MTDFASWFIALGMALGAGVAFCPQTHIADVANTIEVEEVRRVVLVGHSYGGMAIACVADCLFGRMDHLVYLDAVVPRSGERWSSTHDPAVQGSRRRMVLETGGIAPPDPAMFGLRGDDRDWVQRRQKTRPGGVYDAAFHFDPQRMTSLRRTFVDRTSPALPTLAAMRQRVRAEPGWHVVEIAAGHDATISAPETLASVLLSTCYD